MAKENRELRLSEAEKKAASNVDRIFMAGVQVSMRKHLGLNHQKSVLLYGRALTIFGSSNWTIPSALNAATWMNAFQLFILESWNPFGSDRSISSNVMCVVEDYASVTSHSIFLTVILQNVVYRNQLKSTPSLHESL